MICDELPEWLDREAWLAFLEMRKAKGRAYPFTPRAKARILQKIAAFHALGQDTTEILWRSANAGWSDVYELKVQHKGATVESFDEAQSKKWIAEQAAHAAKQDNPDKVREAQERMNRIKQSIRGKV